MRLSVSDLSPADLAWEHFHNPRAMANQTYPAALHRISSLEGFRAAKEVIEALPLYVRTPLHRLRVWPRRLGLRSSMSKTRAPGSGSARSKALEVRTLFIDSCELARQHRD